MDEMECCVSILSLVKISFPLFFVDCNVWEVIKSGPNDVSFPALSPIGAWHTVHSTCPIVMTDNEFKTKENNHVLFS